MKNIFIGGTAKSGKSTLSKKLCEKGNYNHIPLDYFASSFKHNFPELGISSNVIINDESSKKLSLFLKRVIEIINNSDELFIIDSAHILPSDIINYLDRNKWEVYYLGYPETSANEKIKQIRKYESISDWTYNKTDKELYEIFDKLIDLSKKIKDECETNNIEFIDTSK